MPLVTVEIIETTDAGYVAAVLDSVRCAVTAALHVPDDRVVVRAVVTPASHVSLPGCRTVRFTQITIAMYAGRGPELKAALIEQVRSRLAERPGIEPSEVAVALHDLTATDLDVLPGEAPAPQ